MIGPEDPSESSRPVILAIDPGQAKCGLAVVRGEVILQRHVAFTRDLEECLTAMFAHHKVDHVVVGSGTRREDVVRLCLRLFPERSPVCLDEANSTLEARCRYFAAHPRTGWRRWVPLSMQVPPEAYDDFAAVVLAERFLAKMRNTG